MQVEPLPSTVFALLEALTVRILDACIDRHSLLAVSALSSRNDVGPYEGLGGASRGPWLTMTTMTTMVERV